MRAETLLSQYSVTVERDEAGYYHACYPTLGPTLFRAVGETEDEARETLAEVAPLVLEWFLEEGNALPPPGELDRQKRFVEVLARPSIGRACVYSMVA